MTVRVSVTSSNPPVRTDFSATELQAMANQTPNPQHHRVLGFYKDTLGYRLAVSSRSELENSCPAISVHVQLVEAERIIEIARDLKTTPCIFQVALSHYQQHAEAAYAALNGLAVSLPATLHAEVEHELPTYPGGGDALRRGIEARLNKVLDAEIAAYTGEFQAMQNGVDTPAEVSKLDNGCGNASPARVPGERSRDILRRDWSPVPASFRYQQPS
ncbi:MAG: hypothetical protein J0H14_07535 [Alphaproteobacteria bacterium]|nr:hypothetical protein [Alphaproteobacteria bacterium]